MKHKILLLIAVLVGAALLANRPQGDLPLAVPQGAQSGELTALHTCDYQPSRRKAKVTAQCGTLTVPEIWDNPDSRLIALPVVRIPATGSNPANPIFYLQGGPGQSNLSWSPPAWLLENHDVVFVGYRGVDGMVSLDCPEMTRLTKAHIGKDFLSMPARDAYKTVARRCAAAHQEAGVDLSGYTVPNVVEDLEAARTALGYDHINLLSESYGTRVAQIYAYMYPGSLQRLVLIGVNTPGHFVSDPPVYDGMFAYLGALCARDTACSSRTADFAQTIYTVNHNMPRRWLLFNIDPDSVRLGVNFLLFDNRNMSLAFDAYLAAAEGDPSALAMLNLMTAIAPIGDQLLGDVSSKAGSLDLEWYRQLENAGLGDSVMGAPMTEWIWPVAQEWPLELAPAELRNFQESNVEMLLVNGAVDFSTPPTALDEARPYYHKAQMILLPEFAHISDVMETLQPRAFQRLLTSYYDTGVADDSLYVYEPLSFQPRLSLTTVARLLVAGLVIVPALLILAGVLVVRRLRRRSAVAN